jgi:outer membrane lipoprotein-sorting protein
MSKFMRILFLGSLSVFVGTVCSAQTPEMVISQVRARLDKVNDYEAKGKMKTNVVFIKAPVATVRIYFKKPNKLRIRNESGISFVPKGSVNINLNSIFVQANTEFDMIDLGKEPGSGLRIIKMLPKDENADVVLSTLYIDEANSLIRKAKTTTRENGSYQLEMSYGKYREYGLADKVILSFNTKDYKLPKGVTFDYDDGSQKKNNTDKLKNKKGRVEIVYSNYIINKGIPDTIFE